MRDASIIPRSNPLGIALRAQRFGFYYANKYQTYVRMSFVDEEKGITRVEFCPANQIMQRTHFVGKRSRASQTPYIVWNEPKEEKEEILEALSQYISSQTGLSGIFIIDENGEATRT